MYLSRTWTENPGPREKADIPAEIAFQTKPPIALALRRCALAAGLKDYDRSEAHAEEWRPDEWPEATSSRASISPSCRPMLRSPQLVDADKLRWRIERDDQELRQKLGRGHQQRAIAPFHRRRCTRFGRTRRHHHGYRSNSSDASRHRGEAERQHPTEACVSGFRPINLDINVKQHVSAHASTDNNVQRKHGRPRPSQRIGPKSPHRGGAERAYMSDEHEPAAICRCNGAERLSCLSDSEQRTQTAILLLRTRLSN